MTGQFIYLSRHPTGIALITAGYYAGGIYHENQIDQFFSKDTMAAFWALAATYEPYPFPKRICTACAKRCHNLTVYGDCCSYRPIPGLHAAIAKYCWGVTDA